MVNGPGWINDIVDMTVNFDPDLFTVEKVGGFDRKHFRSDCMITGTVTVKPPEGRTIKHKGISMALSTWAADRVNSPAEIGKHLIVIQEEGAISETANWRFEIDPSKFSNPVPPTYTTDNFDIRHDIACTMARPWWTFPVEKSETVIFEMPRVSMSDEGGASSSEDPVIVVDDFGGICTFKHSQTSYPVDGGALKGSITLSSMQGKAILPVAEVAVILGRTDTLRSNTEDCEVRKWLFHTPPSSVITADKVIPVQIAFSEAPADAEWIRPTLPHYSAEEPFDTAISYGAEYWLRLVVTSTTPEGPLKSWWNTQPIKILNTSSRNSSGGGATGV